MIDKGERSIVFKVHAFCLIRISDNAQQELKQEPKKYAFVFSKHWPAAAICARKQTSREHMLG